MCLSIQSFLVLPLYIITTEACPWLRPCHTFWVPWKVISHFGYAHFVFERTVIMYLPDTAWQNTWEGFVRRYHYPTAVCTSLSVLPQRWSPIPTLADRLEHHRPSVVSVLVLIITYCSYLLVVSWNYYTCNHFVIDTTTSCFWRLTAAMFRIYALHSLSPTTILASAKFPWFPTVQISKWQTKIRDVIFVSARSRRDSR